MADSLLNTFVIRGTNSDLDGLEVVCGPPFEFQYVDPHHRDYRKKVVCRPLVKLVGDDEGELPFHGVWIENDWLLERYDDDLFETSVPGKHIKTVELVHNTFSITLVEYEDRLQVSVLEFELDGNKSNVLYTDYKEKKHYGSIMFLMTKCDEETLGSFIDEVGSL